MRWLVLLVLGGCYAPHAAEGAPCTGDAQCPSPQRCVMGSCSLGGAAADARPGDAALPVDAATDAGPDAFALGCVASLDVCGGGGVQFFTCAQRCWLVCQGARPHDTAAALCTAWPGTLAEIDSAAEQDCVAPKVGSKAWIGLAQAAGATGPADGWTWGGTRALTYMQWQNGAPNDADGVENGREQCAHMQDNGTWDDADCGAAHPVICERPLPP